jgi:predicted transposase YbfD/YdcC
VCISKKGGKARGGIEKREYWQTDDISWLAGKKEWTGLKSIAMTCNTITKNGQEATEKRYFISSIEKNVEEVARAIRSRWMIESYHWQLDVTFREDADHTMDKQVANNLNIMRKLALNLLKLMDMGRKNVSINKKRFMICCNPKNILAVY